MNVSLTHARVTTEQLRCERSYEWGEEQILFLSLFGARLCATIQRDAYCGYDV